MVESGVARGLGPRVRQARCRVQVHVWVFGCVLQGKPTAPLPLVQRGKLATVLRNIDTAGAPRTLSRELGDVLHSTFVGV